MKKLIIILITCATYFTANAQMAFELAPPEYIKTAHFEKDGEVLNGVPLIGLGESFTVKFDDIMGDEAFYYYKIKHYNSDWTPSILTQNNFLDGIDNIRIQNTLNSLNTLQIYTHYEVRIPNNNTFALKVSGNYLFEIYNENEALVFSRRFIVYEDLATVQAQIKRSRDLKFVNEKQVVQFSITPDELIINQQKRLQVLVMQNSQLSTAITNLKPQFSTGNTYTYKYDQEASFWGGNEYWNLDSKDLRLANASIAKIELKDIYHHYLFAHPYRALRPYTYNPDVNGNYVVRNIDATNSDIEAEYIWTHFRLKMQEQRKKEVHIYGNFNNYQINASTLLEFDPEVMAYTGKQLLKQGFYNFKYVVLDKDGELEDGYVSGNFDEAENEYIILVYYRAPNDLSERVIGVGSANSRNITN